MFNRAQQKAMAEVSYDDTPKEENTPLPFSELIITNGDFMRKRDSLEDLSRFKKKSSDKGYFSRLHGWLKNHHPFKCCFGGGGEEPFDFKKAPREEEMFDL